MAQTRTFKLPFFVRQPICALGGQMKNTVAFASGISVTMSPVHEDLMTAEGLDAFERDAAVFLRRRPKIIAYDMHPGYQSTLFAQRLRAPAYRKCPVQHHHAHIAACMAQNGLENQKVIGVAFDGTGFGGDGRIWGGEFLVCDYAGYVRALHMMPVPLIGGEQAIRQPWRVAAAMLSQVYGQGFLRFGIDFVRKIDRRSWAAMRQMLAAGVNSPSASSMGRLFDAVASMVFARHTAAYEGQLAIALEQEAARHKGAAAGYRFVIKGGVIDYSVMLRQVVDDIRRRRPAARIAASLHAGISGMIREACGLVRKQTGINAVALSGGVFQNTILLRLSSELLCKDRFRVYTHVFTPPGDASLSFGQAVVAAFQR